MHDSHFFQLDETNQNDQLEPTIDIPCGGSSKAVVRQKRDRSQMLVNPDKTRNDLAVIRKKTDGMYTYSQYFYK